MCLLRIVSIGIVLVLSGTVAAQVDRALTAVRQGQLAVALEALADVREIGDTGVRLEVAERLVALARGDDAERALREARRLLQDPVPEDSAKRCDRVMVAASLGLEAALAGKKVAEPKRLVGPRAMMLRDALAALERLGESRTRRALDLQLTLLPMLIDLKRLNDVRRLGEAAQVGPVTRPERARIRGYMGIGLLREGKADLALPYLDDYVSSAPTDPAHVLPMVERLPRAHADAALRFLQPVIEAPPGQATESWTSALSATYRVLDSLNPRKEPARSLLARQTVRRPLPRRWPGQSWRTGYRTWRSDNQVAGKQYSGRHAIRAALPLSRGWRRAKVPGDLVRWRNSAICFRRGANGPTVVLYWFGPDVHYWYGDTPRKKGVTSKTARGHSRGGIASLVGRIAYGEDARARKREFRVAAPLRFKPAVGGSVRKAWSLGDVLYDETFFSVGQVTGEVLLRGRRADLELLDPEIRWLYRNIRVE